MKQVKKIDLAHFKLFAREELNSNSNGSAASLNFSNVCCESDKSSCFQDSEHNLSLQASADIDSVKGVGDGNNSMSNPIVLDNEWI